MSVLPSGWAVLELVKHLTHVERRWLVWGFEGQPVAQPWGDSQDGRWHVSDTEGSADLVRALQAQGSVTSSVARAHDLCDVGRPGERWEGADPRTSPSTYEHRSRGLLGVPSQVALHDEAPERCAEHHRRVQPSSSIRRARSSAQVSRFQSSEVPRSLWPCPRRSGPSAGRRSHRGSTPTCSLLQAPARWRWPRSRSTSDRSPPREPPRRRATTAAAWSGRSRSSGRPPLRTRGSAHRRR